MKQSIEIHIEELVLHGFASHQRQQISEAVQAELQQLLTLNGIPSRLAGGGITHAVNAGSFEMQQGAKPARIGQSIAGSIYNSFSNGKK